MPAQFLTGFKSITTANISAVDTVLPLPIDAITYLQGALITGDYSYVLITSSTGFTEVVRIEIVAGVVTMTRDANSQAFVEGSCVRFEPTEQLILEFTQAPQPRVCTANLPIVVTPDPTDPNCLVLSFDASVPGQPNIPIVFTVGTTTYTYENGVLTSAITNGGLVAGVYENATITLNAKGEITAIEQGSNIVFNQKSCCGCTEVPNPG